MWCCAITSVKLVCSQGESRRLYLVFSYVVLPANAVNYRQLRNFFLDELHRALQRVINCLLLCVCISLCIFTYLAFRVYLFCAVTNAWLHLATSREMNARHYVISRTFYVNARMALVLWDIKPKVQAQLIDLACVEFIMKAKNYYILK